MENENIRGESKHVKWDCNQIFIIKLCDKLMWWKQSIFKSDDEFYPETVKEQLIEKIGFNVKLFRIKEPVICILIG